MMEIISQITIAEVMLLFNLLFMVPLLVMLLLKLKKYESLFGELPDEKGRKSRREEKAEPAREQAGAKNQVPDNVFPYKARAFMTNPEKACLAAMREALGPEVEVFPKVAVWETLEPTERNPGYAERLHGKDYDFLVCDARTGAALTAVMFKPGKGRPAGPLDELKKICSAAECNVVLIDMAEEYDAKSLKEELGIPDLDL